MQQKISYICMRFFYWFVLLETIVSNYCKCNVCDIKNKQNNAFNLADIIFSKAHNRKDDCADK